MARRRKYNVPTGHRVGARNKRKVTRCKNCHLDRYLDENGLCLLTCSPKKDEDRK